MYAMLYFIGYYLMCMCSIDNVIVGLNYILSYSHVVRWDSEGEVTDPTQLTLPDFTHDVTMNKVTITTNHC